MTGARTGAGPVAEEAAKLAEALQAWLGSGTAAGLPIAHGSGECTICPLCQAIRALRGIRPEVVEHLVNATSELTAAVRAAAATSTGEESRRTRVEKIDVED